MNEFQEQLLDHYHNPRHFGEPLFMPTHSAKASNLSCGDELEMWFKVNTDNIIEDISFKGEGCSISIASTSLLCEYLKGKSVSEMNSLNQEYVLNMIGIPLTISRMKCALLPLDALQKSRAL